MAQGGGLGGGSAPEGATSGLPNPGRSEPALSRFQSSPVPNAQMGKLRLGEVKLLAQGHRFRNGQRPGQGPSERIYTISVSRVTPYLPFRPSLGWR